MSSRETLQKALLSRDIALAYAVIVALYLLKFVPFRPLQILPYLLIVSYDLVEATIPLLTRYYPVAFPLFLYVLAVGSTQITRKLRTIDGDRPVRLQTLGGVCLVVGVLSLGFGAFVGGPVVSPTDNPTPLTITGITGGLLLVVAWWLFRHPIRSTTSG